MMIIIIDNKLWCKNNNNYGALIIVLILNAGLDPFILFLFLIEIQWL